MKGFTLAIPDPLRAASRLLVLAVAAGLIGCHGGQPQTPDSYALPSHADASFESGTDLPPTPRTLHAMATLLATQGRDESAVFVLNRLLTEAPAFLPAYSDLAEIHVRRGRVHEAIGVLEAGRQIAPRDAVLANNLGLCWMLQADYARALAQFEQAVAAAPQNARFHANKATALGLLGRDDECLRAYAYVLPPNQARHNLEVLKTARRRMAGESQDDALAAEAVEPSLAGGGPHGADAP